MRPEQLHVGDVIEIARSGHAPGARDGAGRVVEVMTQAGTGLYRVRWAEGVETIFCPGRDVLVRRGDSP